MAINSGAGPHFAWLVVDGTTLPIELGHVNQHGTKKTSSFDVDIPMSYPGAADALANLGDNTASVIVSTRGVQGTLITGEIDQTHFDFISREIKVTGRDGSAKLHDNKTSEKWINRKGSDIVSTIAGLFGLGVNIDASGLMAGKQLYQDYVRLSDNVSYAYIIHKLAELDGARWWVDPQNVLHYVSTSNPSGIYTLNYSPGKPIVSDCHQLIVSRNVQAGKNVNVTVKSWHPKDKTVYQYQSNVEGSGGPKNYNYHIPNLKMDHVKQYAKSLAKEFVRHELRLQATVVGDPTCYAGLGLQLNGTGYYDQLYDIDTVSHEIGMRGHWTHITTRAPKSGRTAT